MGETNKLKLPIRGVPMIKRVTQVYLASRLSDLLVVTGHQANLIERYLAGLPVTIVYNKRYKRGMTSSINTGLRAITESAQGILIATADTPNLSSQHVNQLIKAYNHQLKLSPYPIVRSESNGQLTHPTIFHPHYINQLLSCKQMDGCKEVILANQSQVFSVTGLDSILTDIDTPDEYLEFKKK